MSAAVAITGLTVCRGGNEVVRDVSFTLAHGSLTGLVGPSGCGKTTLMRSIVGVQRITRGTISVLDLPAGHARLRRQVGYATQRPAVYDDLTLADNLWYFATILGADQSDIDRVVDETDMAEHAHLLVSRLSGGERSRASLAVALLGRPRLVILDEPTADLDPVLRNRLWEVFHRLAGSGTALLISSHVMEEAIRCERLLFMRGGRLIASGTPSSLLRDTESRTLEESFLRIVERTE